jgi:hypothetical protein
MISDVMFEAVSEVRRYQAEFPAVYGRAAGAIDAAVAVMDALRAAFGAPPGDDPNDARGGRILQALAALDLSELREIGCLEEASR